MTKTVVVKTHSLMKITKYLHEFTKYCIKISAEFDTKFPKVLDKKPENIIYLESYDEAYFNQYEKNALKTIEIFEKFLQDDTNEEKKEIRILLKLSAEYIQLLTNTIPLYDNLPNSKNQILKNIVSLNDIHHKIHIYSRMFIHKLTQEGIVY